MKLFCGIFMLLMFSSAVAQKGKLTLHGKVKNESRIVGETKMEVYKNNEMYLSTMSQKNGSFKLDLPLGSIYSITFKKEGYIDKSIAVVGKSDSTINGRYFFQLDIELFKVGQESFDESLLPPVAKLYLKTQSTGFKYDKKYVRWIANEYEDFEE